MKRVTITMLFASLLRFSIFPISVSDYCEDGNFSGVFQSKIANSKSSS